MRHVKRVDGNRIREARKAAGLTQDDLARLTGVRVGAINNWEREKHRPLADNLFAIASATGKPLEFFFIDDELTEADAGAEEVYRRVVNQ